MMRAGFTDYLTKPVNIDEMERMMIRYLPQDSVILNNGNDVDADDEDDELSKLLDVIFDHPEIDPVKGIEYCGDAEDYLFALETYAESVDARAGQIEADCRNGDLENLAINVHSLKSTSAAIGAGALSEKAKALELAAKSGDTASISDIMPELLSDYRSLKVILGEILGSS